MNHGRSPALPTREASLDDLLANDSKLEDLPREDLLRLLKTIRQQQQQHFYDHPSSRVGSAERSGQSSPFAAFAAARSPTSPGTGLQRGAMVTWDHETVSDYDGHTDNTRNSPNDECERGARSRPSLHTISGVLSTDGSQGASTSTMLPNTTRAVLSSTAASAADTAPSAPNHNNDRDSAAAGDVEEQETSASGDCAASRSGDHGRVSLTGAADFTSPLGDAATALHTFGVFSPLSNELEIESVASPRSSLMRGRAGSLSSGGAGRHTHHGGGKGANRYSCSSYSSSTYDTVDCSVAEDTMNTAQGLEQTTSQRLRTPRQGGLAFTSLPVVRDRASDSSTPNKSGLHNTLSVTSTESPIALSNATVSERAVGATVSEASLRPPQTETLPPPRDLCLRAPGRTSGGSFLSLSSSASVYAAEHGTPERHDPQQQQQVQQQHHQQHYPPQGKEAPFSLGQTLQQARQIPPPRLFVASAVHIAAVAAAAASRSPEMVVAADPRPTPPISPSSSRSSSVTDTSSTSTASQSVRPISSCAASQEASTPRRISAVSTPLDPDHHRSRGSHGGSGAGPRPTFTNSSGGSSERSSSAAVVVAGLPSAMTEEAIQKHIRNHEGGPAAVSPESLISAVLVSQPAESAPSATPPVSPMTPASGPGSAVQQPTSPEAKTTVLNAFSSTNSMFRNSNPARGASVPVQATTAAAAAASATSNAGKVQMLPVRTRVGGAQKAMTVALDMAGLTEESPQRPRTEWRERKGFGLAAPTSYTAASPNHQHSRDEDGTDTQSVHSPRPIARATRRAQRAAAGTANALVGLSNNTLVSVDTAGSTDIVPLSACTPTVGAASVEFKLWTQIVSWDKDEASRITSSARDRSGAAASTATTTTNASSALPSSQLGRADNGPLSSAQTVETPFSQDSVLSPTSPASNAPEIARARQTASLRRVRHAKTGDRYINNYRILKSLGRGSCGKVKLAYDEVESRLVAIKNVRRADTRKRIGGLTAAQKQYNAFMREIEIMKKLRHRNIVSLYEVIDDPSADKLYLIMQYVDKGVIAKVEVRANSDRVCDPIPPAQLGCYAREILTGLQYLHRNNVVHRDLKPDNILVSKDGHAYLADFGVAETFDTFYRQRRQTIMAQSMAMSLAMSVAGGRAGGPQVLGTKGTPLFIAPELWDGAKSYGKPVDMWAMGVTLFTLLVGKLPFANPEDITDPGVIPVVPTEFGEKWRELLGGLLNRDPATRWTVEMTLKFVVTHLTDRGSLTESEGSSTAVSSTTVAESGSTSAPANTSVPSMIAAQKDTLPRKLSGSSPRVPGPLRRPSLGSANTRASPRAPLTVKSYHPIPSQPLTGGPGYVARRPLMIDEAADAAFRNTISTYPAAAAPAKLARPGPPVKAHSVFGATAAGIAPDSLGTASRMHGLKDVVLMARRTSATRTAQPAGQTSDEPTATSPPSKHPSPPPPRSRQKSEEPRRLSESTGSDNSHDLPSFAGSATSETETGGAADAKNNSDGPHSGSTPSQPSAASTTTIYRAFAARRSLHIVSDVPLMAAASADAATLPSFIVKVPRQPASATLGAAETSTTNTPWLPISGTSTQQSGEFPSVSSSHAPSVATIDDAGNAGGNGSGSAVYSSVLSSRLLPPSVPRPYSSRQSDREDSATTQPLAASSVTSVHLTAHYHSRPVSVHSREERGAAGTSATANTYTVGSSGSANVSGTNGSLPRYSPNGPLMAASPDLCFSSSNSSTTGRLVPHSPSARNAAPTPPMDARERSRCMTPVDAAGTGSGAEGAAHARSPARLPGISPVSTASIPSPPSCLPIAAALSAPTALLPIKVLQPGTPPRLQMARPLSSHGSLNAYSSSESVGASRKNNAPEEG